MIIFFHTKNLKKFMENKLSNFVTNGLIRDVSFLNTSFPDGSHLKSIAYCVNALFIPNILINKNIIGVITSSKLKKKFEEVKGLAISENPSKTFFNIHNKIYHSVNNNKKPIIGDNVFIHPSAIIEDDVIIGNNVHIGAYSIIKSQTIIKNDVFVDSNVVIGCTGHFYKFFDNKLFNVYHAGGVLVQDGAQLLTGCRVAKSVFNDHTVIGQNSVISINVNIGHSTFISDNVIIAGSSQVSGFCQIGKNVWIGPGVTVSDSIIIGENARIEIGSIVIDNISENSRVSGPFATDHLKNLKNYIKIKRN